DCVIKIFKFPEEKDIIHETVHKHFPFLSYTNSNAWYRDVFKYIDSEAKCPVCKEVHKLLGIWVIGAVLNLPEIQVSVPNKISNSLIHPNKTHLYQYAIEYEMDPEKFSVITEAEKKRWTMGCFRGDLERDIRCYCGGIKKNEDTRKYHKFLTDWERLTSEELLRHGILKSCLSTAWLDDLMEEWEKTYNQFIMIPVWELCGPVAKKLCFFTWRLCVNAVWNYA
ncbi:6263_t:CDS:2, partial [Diversispora eburnea]